MNRLTVASSMATFLRNSRPHRIAVALILMATIYLFYISFHQTNTGHAAHPQLVSKAKLTWRLLEERKRSNLDSDYSDNANFYMDGTADKLVSNMDSEQISSLNYSYSAPTYVDKDRNKLWVQSEVTGEIHWLDNTTLHKFPPVVPIKCNTGVKKSDFLNMEPINFLSNYKNPCWVEPIDGPISHMYSKNGFLFYSASYKKVFMKLRGIIGSQKSSNPVRIRCLPYFFISGQPKCGSTDLYNKLISHPHIATPPTKESHWWGKNRYGWCLNYSRPIPFRDYADLYDYASIEIQSMTEDSQESGKDFHPVITGDASVSTLWSNDDWWSNPENCGLTEPLYTNAHHLHHILPSARIIVILRNPTDRLYSDYLYFREKKSISDFHQVVDTAIKNINECFGTMGIRSCVYNATLAYTSRLRIRIGLYHVFLQEWLSVFPKNQILVLRLEDYASKPLEVMKKVLKFLGLKELSETEQAQVMSQPKSNTRRVRDKKLGSMMDETRDMLNNFYRPFNVRLARLMNNPDFLWEQ